MFIDFMKFKYKFCVKNFWYKGMLNLEEFYILIFKIYELFFFNIGD